MIIWEVFYLDDEEGRWRRHFVPTKKAAREYRRELVRTIRISDHGIPLKDEDGWPKCDEDGEPTYLQRSLKLSEITIRKIELRAKGGRALAVEGMNYVGAT